MEIAFSALFYFVCERVCVCREAGGGGNLINRKRFLTGKNKSHLPFSKSSKVI